MATLLGSVNGVWGIAAQQTGFLLTDTSQDYECDIKSVKNITGDDTGESHYNERINFSLAGYIPTTSAYSGTISATISLATAPTDHLIGNVTSGMFIVRKISASQAQEDYRKIDVSGVYNPTVTAS